jgi:hypothetical protein
MCCRDKQIDTVQDIHQMKLPAALLKAGQGILAKTNKWAQIMPSWGPGAVRL